MEDLPVDLLMGERLDLESTKPERRKVNNRGQRVVKTLKGREIAADLIVSGIPLSCGWRADIHCD